jgi:hypothetical protein
MKKILQIVGAALGTALVLVLLYAADDDRAMGPRRRFLRIVSDGSLRGAVSSTKEAAHSVSDAATKAIGQKVDEAAQHFSDSVHNAAAKVMADDLPEHVRIGISHFESIPAVLTPVVFDENGLDGNATRFSFRTSVRSGSADESVTVEANAPTLEAAWEKFQLVMSDRITDLAVSEAKSETGANHVHDPELTTSTILKPSTTSALDLR